MRTYGFREGNITLGPIGRWDGRGGIALGEILNGDDWLTDAAIHYGTCIPM